jgi:monofunctional biosynthetic peptidoglycan transglycosylase
VKRAELGRWLRWTLLLLLIVLTTIQAWYLCWVVYWRWHNPALTAFMSHAQERLAARNPPARLKQQWIAYGRISGNLKRAVVAAEDARFLEHEGVDWEALEKAYEQNRPMAARRSRSRWRRTCSCRRIAPTCARSRSC